MSPSVRTSPVMPSRLRSPIACAPSRSDWMPSRFLSRHEYWSTVSTPACCWIKHGERQRAHARARARTIEDRQRRRAAGPPARARRRSPTRRTARAAAPARRHDELARVELRRQARLRRSRRRAIARAACRRPRSPSHRRAARRAPPPAPVVAPLPLICRMCSGVVPQQPPTSRTPLAMKRRAYDAMYSGEQR